MTNSVFSIIKIIDQKGFLLKFLNSHVSSFILLLYADNKLYMLRILIAATVRIITPFLLIMKTLWAQICSENR
jgi:hypothetical protein